MNIYFVTSH